MRISLQNQNDSTELAFCADYDVLTKGRQAARGVFLMLAVASVFTLAG
jgi:hypothetical protein